MLLLLLLLLLLPPLLLLLLTLLKLPPLLPLLGPVLQSVDPFRTSSCRSPLLYAARAAEVQAPLVQNTPHTASPPARSAPTSDNSHALGHFPKAFP
jgi:hypothetical protein